MKNHGPELRLALTGFLVEMHKKASVGTQRKFADKHAYTSDVAESTEIINQPKNCDYLLPVAVAKGGLHAAVLLCRSAIVELTRAYLGNYWDSVESVFPSTAVMTRKKKKRNLLRILTMLLKDQTGPDEPICWEKPAFRRLNMSKDTAKHWVSQYQLREIVSGNWVRSIEHHGPWLRDTFRGIAVPLAKPVVDHKLPVLAKRGTVNAGYKSVQPESVGNVAALKPKSVQFRKIESVFSPDQESHEIVQKCLAEPIAAALGVTSDILQLLSAFLRSPGHAPQIPHFDYRDTELQQNPNQIFLGLTPLTENGSYLQVWDCRDRGSRGQVIFIPYGYLLILPGDTMHGGGFQQCFQTWDLRLHFYIYIRTNGLVDNKNVYQSLEEYPMSSELDELNGSLHAIFTVDAEQPRRKKMTHPTTWQPIHSKTE
jgi:hypothetical protein